MEKSCNSIALGVKLFTKMNFVFYNCINPVFSILQGPLEPDWKRRQKSIFHCLPSVTSFPRSLTENPNIFPTETPNSHVCYKIPSEVTRKPSWSLVCPPPITTMMRPLVRCVTPTEPRISRTNQRLMRIQKMRCWGSTKKRLNDWRPCWWDRYLYQKEVLKVREYLKLL